MGILGKYRFYCPECGHFMSRRFVSYDVEQDTYYCRICDSPVIRTKRVLLTRLEDDIELIIKHKKEDYFT